MNTLPKYCPDTPIRFVQRILPDERLPVPVVSLQTPDPTDPVFPF